MKKIRRFFFLIFINIAEFFNDTCSSVRGCCCTLEKGHPLEVKHTDGSLHWDDNGDAFFKEDE